MNKGLVLITLIIALCGAVMGANNAPAHRMVAQTTWLADHANDSNLVVLHVGGDRKSYDQEHIPAARFLPLSDIATTRNGVPNELPPVADLTKVFERLGVGDKSLVVLYGDEFGLLASRAWFTLKYLGKNSVLLDGGVEKWKAERRELTTVVPPAPQPVTLHVKVHPELLVDLPAMQKIVKEKSIPVIDARPPEQYSGAVPGDGVKRAGHIPGATNVFWVDNLVSRQDPVLKSLDQIRARYAAAGLKPRQKVVVYCRSGMQAAHDFFTLELAGFIPVLYDGSFYEWTQAGADVETSPAK
jgi:thiosulfate/3-mercaptopyruvate sulfurtransferase